MNHGPRCICNICEKQLGYKYMPKYMPALSESHVRCIGGCLIRPGVQHVIGADGPLCMEHAPIDLS